MLNSDSTASNDPAFLRTLHNTAGRDISARAIDMEFSGARGIGLNGSGAFQRAFSYPEQGSSYYLRQCKVLSPSSGGKRPSRLSDPHQG